MPIPSEKQLIKEAQEINDSDLVFWQKVELLRRYYESIENPEQGISLEEFKKKHNVKKIKQNVLFNRYTVTSPI